MAAINKNIVVASVALPLDEEEQTRKKRRTRTIWTRSCPANIRLDEDVLKTSWRRLSSSSSEDGLIKTNMFALALHIQKTSSRRLGQNQYIRPGYTSSRRLQDVCLQDVFKTSCKSIFKKSSRCLQDVLKTSSKHLQDIFKTSSRRII